jgi:uncharacterized protein YjbJ (UPF0337 family)
MCAAKTRPLMSSGPLYCIAILELFASQHVLSARPKIERNALMDKDRIQGSAEQAKGKIKEVAGKITGDAKLESEGKAEKTAGKIQNAVGGLKDTLRGK